MTHADRELPEGWKWTTLGEVCLGSQYGWTTSAAPEGDIQFLRTTDITSGSIDWATVPFCKESPADVDKYLLRDGDIVISRAGSVGYSMLVREPKPAVFASYLIRFRPLFDPKYTAYFLQSADYWKAISEQSLGIAIPNVNASKLRQIPFPLAPLPEQRRIVAKIEELFSRLDAGVAALKRVQAALKRYKASVLKAACEGRLVPQDPSDEPADVLLERILAERRTKWEADRRKKGKDFSKAGYDEPPPPELTGLPKLPSTWCWASAEQLTDPIRSITYGVVKLGAETSSGIPTLRSSNVRPLMIESGEIKRISPEISAQYGRTVLEGGEVLITVRGTLGGVAAVSSEYAGFNISREVALLAIGDYELASSIQYLIASPVLQTWLSKRTRGIAYTGINIETLKELPIPIIPRRELGRIRNEIERQLSVIGRLEQCATESLLRAARLRQAILSQAFSGGLVPQDPSDEPAERLLDEIRPGQISTLDERAAKPGQRKARATA